MNQEMLRWKRQQWIQRQAKEPKDPEEYGNSARAVADEARKERMRVLQERREVEEAEREVWDNEAVRATAKSWAERWGL